MKALDDQSSYDKRQRASVALKQYLDTYLPFERVLVVGDWNDDVDASVTRGASGPLASPYQNLVEDSADYRFVTDALQVRGGLGDRDEQGDDLRVHHQLQRHRDSGSDRARDLLAGDRRPP